MNRRRRSSPRVVRPASLAFAAVLGVALLLVTGPRTAAGAAPPPQNVEPPSIEGVAQEGRILRVEVGKWRPTPGRGASYAYQWRLCDTGSAACVDVAKATDSIYTVRHADIGHTLRVVVSPVVDPRNAPRGVEDASVVSAPTVQLAPAAKDAPVETVRPTISGTATVGATLTAHAGTWSGAQPVRLRYRWRSCDPLGGSCRELRRHGETYVVRPADLHHSLRVLVTARNPIATAAALSDPTPMVAASPRTIAPKATAEPTIGGTPMVGKVLRATNGTWTGTTPLRFTYHWRRCQGAGKPDASDCKRIARASDATYTVRRADVGARLRVQVTATNAAGSATSTSNPTAVVAPPPPRKVAPRATAEPKISGTARAGQALRATRGTWVGTKPLSFAYHWVRCGPDGGAPDGSNCAAIGGATGASYRLAGADVGKRLRVLVTASNDVGSQTVASNATSTVQAAPPPPPAAPRNTREPAIAGTPTQGQTLTANGGTWVGAEPISLGYQWLRCGADGGKPDGSNCAVIPGATATKYGLAAGDVGHRLRIRVTAKNAGGAATAASNPTATIKAPAPPPSSPPPRDTREPAIAGTPTQGGTLTATGGRWVGASPISLGYQWVRCGADGGKPDGSNCAPIAGATTTKYVPTRNDVGKRLRVRVTARNSSGTFTVASNPTPAIAPSEAPLPAGAVKLPNGTYSIPVSSVSLPARLIVNRISFTPNPVRSRRTVIRLLVHVVDTRGFVVRNALVFARSTPLVTLSNGERRTGRDGWATVRLVPRATFPIRNGYNVQFFVRARKAGDNILAGVSTRRLVQVRTHR